jgi:ElaB/YqjD/DUF883 family membrane-anchored ribosome-binding protein
MPAEPTNTADTIADTSARPHPVNLEAGEHALADTAAAALKQAKAKFDVKADAAMTKARAALKTARAEAVKRSAQGVEVVRERPYAAMGAALFVGFVLGHLMSANRPQTIYIRDPH